MKLVLAVLFFQAITFSQIVETKKIEDALAYAKTGSLVVFDLDNTIIMPAQMLGGEEWFDYQLEKYIKGGKPKIEAVAQALAEWVAIQKTTESVPVEKNGPAAIRQTQESGIKVLALTSRPGSLSSRTVQQLASIGIVMSASDVTTKPVVLPGVKPVPFVGGVMFADTENKKGDVLVEYLKYFNEKPTRIVFVDNKRHHLENIEKALEAYSGVDYVGCRHGASDEKIAAFDPATADIQFTYFGRILDNEAAARLKNPSGP